MGQDRDIPSSGTDSTFKYRGSVVMIFDHTGELGRVRRGE